MADEEKEAAAAPAGEPKKKTFIILIVVLVLVGLALAAGIALFVSQKMLADVNTEQMGSGGSDMRFHDTGVFIKLGDPKEGILVNVGGPRSNKFLKVSLVLEMNPNKKDIITETGALQPIADTKILDTTMQFLRSTKLEDFDATKQDELKKQLKDQLNAELGGGSVYEVYITSFLLQ
ncbi:MAG: flagellar basal body-associated FliL family protein [Selenomonadaceae bacterium]|nr:flagellar basal body-associated FliL family protein [Selenomonadaceae bacterium]